MLSICNLNIDNLKPLKSFVNVQKNVPRSFYLATQVGRASSGVSLASWEYL